MCKLKAFFAVIPKKAVIIIFLIAVLGAGGYLAFKSVTAAGAKSTTRENTARVARGDLEVFISGTGTVQPIARFDIVPLVKGKILEAQYEEGAYVKKGDLLYRIDDSDLSYNIQKAQNSVEKIRINYKQSVESLSSLVVTAPFSGQLSNFTLKPGEQVGSNTKIGELINNKKITAVIPYIQSQAAQIKVGQKAKVLVLSYLSYFDGEVTYVNRNPSSTNEGGLVCDVEIEFNNPGAITEGMEVSSIVSIGGTDISSSIAGKTVYSNKQQIVTQATGKVKHVLVRNNEWVNAGQKILEIENESLKETIYKNSLDLQDAQLSLEAQKKQLENYNILSPINGTVIKKSYKEGDTINNSVSSNSVLMTVADLSKMVFSINVDELDIAKVSKGQKVQITADALPGENLEGIVTNVSVEGTSQNGVTTYPVEVTISSPGKLKPGMNVNAKIMVESKKNVLYLPVSAVTKVGNRAFVTIKANGSTRIIDARALPPDSPVRQVDSENQDRGTRIQRRQNAQQGDNQQQDQGQQRIIRQNGSFASENRAASPNWQRKEVQIGINNDNFIEIISGLKEGDTVILPVLSVNTSSSQSARGLNGGIGGIGGFPGGGMTRIPNR
ncbi:MAG: HlyD family efflux transporter periplasmic adaptor subunit [Clostridia bacterium]|nr:HlyD family efflux transporter periplasmic adaptor subunit [Clostridia bacterium]